jgi:glutathione S-transferase
MFAFGTGWGIPFDTSAPFPLKLATFLRMAGIDFEFFEANDPSKGPKGKSPWVELDGVPMGDSSLIIEHLSRCFDVDLDPHLDARQRAMATAVQRMLEEHYHQCFEHQLFFGQGGPERLTAFASSLPVPLRWIVPVVVKRGFEKQLYARGMGRHPEDVIIAQGKSDLDALSALLGDRRYFFGDTPSAIDACIFGFLGVSVYVEGDNPLFVHARSHDNLLRYCERMRARYFPETLSRLPAKFPVEAGGAGSTATLREGVA